MPTKRKDSSRITTAAWPAPASADVTLTRRRVVNF